MWWRVCMKFRRVFLILTRRGWLLWVLEKGQKRLNNGFSKFLERVLNSSPPRAGPWGTVDDFKSNKEKYAFVSHSWKLATMSYLTLCDVSGFLNLNVLTLGLDHALLWEAALSIRGGILGLHPLEARETTSVMIMKISLWGQNFSWLRTTDLKQLEFF